MKILLVLWAVGLAKCDKLDRTYLPPSYAPVTGKYFEGLNLPSEFQKENDPSTLQSEGDSLSADRSINSKYPNIALGIDRQGLSVSASKFFTNQPGIFVSKNIQSIPTTTISYDLTDTSSLLPVQNHDNIVGSMTTVSQGYSSTPSPFEPNLSYDQYLIQQTIKSNQSARPVPTFAARNPVISFPNSQSSKSSDLKTKNIQEYHQSPALLFSDVSKQMLGELGHIDNTSVTFYPQENLNQHVFVSSEGIPNIISQGFRDPTETRLSFSSIPSNTYFDTLVVDKTKPSLEYSSLPKSSKENLNTGYITNIQPQRKQAEGDRSAVILNYENVLTPEGFAYSFDTSNGIHVDESGTAVNGVKAKGSYSFTGDDGKVYSIEYTADENGFLPRGDHLPTPPPVPYAILKSIEQAERNKNLGINEDGSYDDAKYGHGRYQGLMFRMPQNQYNKIRIDQPGVVQENTELGITYDSPNLSQSGGLNKKYSYGNDDNNVLPSFDGNTMSNNNSFFNSKPNNKLINKLKGDIVGSSSSEKEYEAPNNMKTPDTFSPTSFTNLPKEDNAQNEYNYQSGYEYPHSEHIFNENDKNDSQSNLSNGRRIDKLNLNGNEKIIGKDFTHSKVPSEFQIQNSGTNSQHFRKTFKDPIATSDYTDSIKPNIPSIYNQEPGQAGEEKNIAPITVFSTADPTYADTTLKPHIFPSPYTPNGYNKQRNDYPSSTIAAKYFKSTTPTPSNAASSLTPSRFIYSQTTLVTSSTLRPSITSERPNSATVLSPDGYTQRKSNIEQVSQFTTMKPNIFGQRIIGQPRCQGRHNKVPASQASSSENFKHEVQNIKLSSRPKNIENQSSTEKAIGEDFSGPKQQQRFDPDHGYYY